MKVLPKNKVILFLTQDLLFKPNFLKTVIASLEPNSIMAVIEVQRTDSNGGAGILKQWGFFGTLLIALELVILKIRHLLFKYANIYPATSIQNICAANCLPYHFSEDINSQENFELVRRLNGTLCISFQHQKISEELVKASSDKFYNIHPSLLPKFRGVKPIHWAAFHSEDKIGCSIHKVTDTYDSGEVLASREIRLDKNLFSIFEYYKFCHYISAITLIEFISSTEKNGTPKPSKDVSFNSYFRAPNMKFLVQ